MSDISAHRLSEGDVAQIRSALEGVEEDAIVVRPHKDNSGIEGMDEVLRSLPRAQTSSGSFFRGKTNTSPPFAFEMRYAPDPFGANEERVLSLQYVGSSPEMSALLGRHLADKYPDSRTEQRPATWLSPEPGQSITVATLGLRRYTLYPLKNIELDEFRRDPTGSILTEMVGAAEAGGVDADVAVQIMVRPAASDWQDGVPGGYGLAEEYGNGYTASEDRVTEPFSTEKLRWFLNQPTHERRPVFGTPVGWVLSHLHPVFVDHFEHPPSKADKQAASMLSDLDGRGWELHVRIVAVSDDAELARDRVESTAQMFDNYYEYRGAQTFLPIPQNGPAAVSHATAAAAREWPSKPAQQIVKPQIEVAGLVNIPEAQYVSTNKMRWSLAKPGEGVPPGTPRFDFEHAGLGRSTASREETQVAMLDASDGGESEPLWYGTGVKYGTEAGVFGDKLVHQFIGGETGMGKTTFLTNFAAQNYRGPGAGLVIDPKGVDADEFIAEWPDERGPEDIVVMDLTDEFEKVPRFNFLEIPDYLEVGSRAHTSYCEALAEDIVAMVAEAGGSDNYMGALMKRVVKAVVRGFAKQDETATLLDVAAVCASSDNLSRFKQKMADNRFEFLRETAERLEQRDDTDLEPLAGRMDEWVLNDNVRELICARESSFSIHDLVENGKWLVVRCKSAGSEAEAAMIGTALIRRTYFAQRHIQPGHTFDLICDEFDNIASEESNIHKVLSEARAFGYRCTLASQAPTNQFPDRVKNAIENQCGTFISFNPGGGKDARWISQQHTVDKEELLNLPRFKFYMRATTEDNELTPSYMVEGFPPVREAREDARSDEEIRGLKQASLDIYGERPLTEAEVRAESPYIGGDANPEDDGESGSGEDSQRTLCKAVYDSALREQEDGLAWVGADAVKARLERYTDDDWTVAQFGALADRTGEVTYRDDAEGGEQLRCTEDGRERFLPAGENQTEGGLSHRSLLRDAYDPLTRIGLEVDLPEQDGGAEVDGVGLIRESFAPDVDPWSEPAKFADALETFRGEHPELAALTDAQNVTLEAESSTSGKPAATCANLAKAVSSDRRCLFLTRPENAKTVFKTLSSPPYLHSSPGDADRRFYNRKRLQVDGERPLRPNTAEQTRWREFDGEIVLEDNEGNEHARFDSPAAVFENLDAYPAHTGQDDIDDEDVGRDGEWRPIAKPWIPELEFDGAVPGEDAWALIVVERDGTLRRFETGEVLIKSGDEGEPEAETDTPDTAEQPGESTDDAVEADVAAESGHFDAVDRILRGGE